MESNNQIESSNKCAKIRLELDSSNWDMSIVQPHIKAHVENCPQCSVIYALERNMASVIIPTKMNRPRRDFEAKLYNSLQLQPSSTYWNPERIGIYSGAMGLFVFLISYYQTILSGITSVYYNLLGFVMGLDKYLISAYNDAIASFDLSSIVSQLQNTDSAFFTLMLLGLLSIAIAAVVFLREAIDS